MRVILADDEPLARQRLHDLINELDRPELDVVAECASGTAVLAAADSADLVLLDIRMPGPDGIEVAAQLARRPSPPLVVFITAHDEHALTAFGLNAIDYLLKPIRRERLAMALDKAATVLRGRGSSEDDTITVTTARGLLRIPLETIFYFQADQKYVTIHHQHGEQLTEASLRSLEARFGERLLRTHRNCLVVTSRIRGLEQQADGKLRVLLDGCPDRPEVSRRQAGQVRARLRPPR